VDGHWKLIVPNAPNVKGDVELYDLNKDPTELTNLAARNGEKVKELATKLDAWWKP